MYYVCVFCGTGVSDEEARSAGPTSNYGTCCGDCFNRHVIDHKNPKRDILKETGRSYMEDQ